MKVNYYVYPQVKTFIENYSQLCADDGIDVIILNIDKRNDSCQKRKMKLEILQHLAYLEGHKVVKLKKNKFGKPYFCNMSLNFNLSHHDYYFAIAISKKVKVGVDLLNSSTIIRYPLTIAFSNHEISVLKGYDQLKRKEIINIMWTVKEAIAKLMGLGMVLDFSEICLAKSINKLRNPNWEFQFNKDIFSVSTKYIQNLLVTLAYEIKHEF